jgi:hypothetical protein
MRVGGPEFSLPEHLWRILRRDSKYFPFFSQWLPVVNLGHFALSLLVS